MNTIYNSIINKLKETEIQHDIKIPLAIESGSRGWGFPSPDSDYDCRFIYVHKPDWYLNIFEKPDFIEYAVDEIYDINGWDIKKVIYHITKSNAVMFEWLKSNEVYIQNNSILNELTHLMNLYFNPIAVSYHYLNIAKNKFKEIQTENQAKLKKYFYILRPLANLQYIKEYRTIPPMEYFKTLEQIELDTCIYNKIIQLSHLKQEATESYSIPKHELLFNFFEKEINYFENYIKTISFKKCKNYQIAEDTFQKILNIIWSPENLNVLDTQNVLSQNKQLYHSAKNFKSEREQLYHFRDGLFETEQYKFLEGNKDLHNIIYLTLSGSHGYGLNQADSDIDLRGVLIEDKKYLFGFNSFEQFEDTETDTVIYSLKKFIKLCTNANPNTLELLGTDEDCIVMMNDAGKLLRKNVDLFLSKNVINSFGNYATAQLRRLSNALCHDHYNAYEQEKHLQNSLTAQIEHFNNTYTSFDKGAFHFYIDEQTNQLLCNIHLTQYPLQDFSGIYSEISNTIKTYNKLNHRNRKKDDKHLYKHAMHLIRLLITGIDILNGKGLKTRPVAEHSLLMDIRNGCYTFEEIFQLADQYQQQFQIASANTRLPDTPDQKKIQYMMMEIYSSFM